MIKRRQFLRLGGICGFGLATIVHQALTQTDKQSTPSQSSLSPKTDTAPAPPGLAAPPRGDVRLVVISDLNSQYGSTSYEPEVERAIALIPGWQPDLVLCGGDMIAGQKPSLSEAQIGAMWAAFDRQIAHPLRQQGIPFGFTIGNHDGSGAQANGQLTFADERRLAAAYWNDPQHDPGLSFIDRAQFPFYYSFGQQNIFYLVWDASTAQLSPEQLAWVETSLASPAAQRAERRIVIGHLPIYGVAVGRDRPGEVLANADKLRSLLERYRVYTYISGHHHAYFPGKRHQLELLHAGALGGGPRQLLMSDLPPMKTLTVVDMDKHETVYTTYEMNSLSVVDINTLPRMISGVNGSIVRRDLRLEELTKSDGGSPPHSWVGR